MKERSKYSLYIYPDSKANDKFARILIRVSIPKGKTDKGYVYERFVISTGHNIKNDKDKNGELKFWDKNKQRTTRYADNALIINSDIDQLIAQIHTHIQEARVYNRPINEYLEIALKGKNDTSKQGFWGFVQALNEEQRVRIKETSMKARKGALDDLKAFEKDNNLDFNAWENFHSENISRWVEFLIQKGNTNATIKKKWTHIKIYLNAALERKISDNSDFKYVRLDLDFESQDIALSVNEVAMLWEMPLNGKEERVRDLFVFLCETGIRFGDLAQIKKQNIHTLETGVKVVKIIMEKTSKGVIFPLSQRALAVLEKHELTLPEYSNQKFNEYLKEVCYKAGASFLDTVEQVVFRGTEKIVNTYQKYELVSAHTARRTWVTIASKAGVSMEAIRQTVGHHSITQSEKYLRVTQLDVAEEIINKLIR